MTELYRELELDPTHHAPDEMEVMWCLERLNEAGLISVDGVPDSKITEFIEEAVFDIYDGDETEIRPRIRASNRWRRIQDALDIVLPETTGDVFSILASPIFGRPARLPRTADVFVLMPFREDMKPVYEDHVVSVVKGLQLSVMRADDLFTNNSVMGDVWSSIVHAKVVIADCTGRNPNVFYETGIAHTIGKPVILVSQDSKDIPVDLRHIKYIVYDYTPKGMKAFETALKRTLENTVAQPAN